MKRINGSITKYVGLLICSLFIVVTACSDDDPELPECPPAPRPNIRLIDNKIYISDIQGMPEDIEFDRISADISGKWWATIETVSAGYDECTITLELPESLPSEQLSPCQWDKEEWGLGFWPATGCTDPLAGVAGLKDFYVYNGTKKVGRIYLTDWSGEGETYNKAYIYYQYVEKGFSLSEKNMNFYNSEMFQASYSYIDANFTPGWNAYANINPSSGSGLIKCTTKIPEELALCWRFELHK